MANLYNLYSLFAYKKLNERYQDSSLVEENSNNYRNFGINNRNKFNHSSANNQIIRETIDNNIILSGSGGVLDGGAGDDTYLFGLNDGKDTINNTGGGDDKLKFTSDIKAENLWFTKSSNHLLINLLGTTDTVTINNWYSGGNYQVNNVEADGLVLYKDQMDQLIQALSSFGQPQGADGCWTDEQKESLSPILSNYWKQGN